MSGHISSITRFLAPVLFVCLLALVFSCGEQPTGIVQEPGDGLSGVGEIDPGASGGFLLGTVSDSTRGPGHIEIWAMGVAFDTASGIVSFDVQLVNRMRTNIPAPVRFVVTRIIPVNIAVVGFDGVTRDGFPYYDFSSKLGDDNVLEPGESSEPVTMKFHTVTPRSFAIGFRIDLGPPPGTGMIAGVVFRDDNRNGVRDRYTKLDEPGIPGITVALEKISSDSDKVILHVRTDRNGEYRFGGLREGVYEIFVEASPQYWEITSPNPLLVTLIKGPDGEVQDFLGANFGLYPLYPPVPDNLFGPILVGPASPYGTLVDSTFTNPPSVLPVVFHYYLEVTEPPWEGPYPVVIDSASAWINDVLVYEYSKATPPDTIAFAPRIIRLRDNLVHVGENKIRLFTDGPQRSALMWRVYRKP
ncbi:MAG: hypothetical protein JSV33_00640 [bacterium]|nr:MAG: hypothetical protein JSV33_00640 [bacterium]